jgi:hypothetical protein
MALQRKSVSLTVIGWIDGALVPMPAPFPIWKAKTTMGLKGTSNTKPPENLGDIDAFRKQKQYRAIIHASLLLTVDTTTKSLHKVELISNVLDPGWTPPLGGLALTSAQAIYIAKNAISPGQLGAEDVAAFDRNFYAGEMAKSSYISVNKDLKKIHYGKQTELATLEAETVVMRAMIKFRAGAHTDYIGHDVIGCPNHVPWTWAEVVLVYRQGKLGVRANCANFPCFSFYLSGDVTKSGSKMGTLNLQASQLGATILTGKTGPNQVSNNEGALSKPMSQHAFTIKTGHMSKEMSQTLML